MELGGKCPAIVLDDADLERAAELCAKGGTKGTVFGFLLEPIITDKSSAMLNHGQICFSTERIIVQEKVAPRFQQMLIQAFKANEIPDNTAVTRVSAQHAADVLSDAKSKGSSFLLGDIGWSGPATLKPSIVLEPSQTARIVDEETFGPSVSLCMFVHDNPSAVFLLVTVWTETGENNCKITDKISDVVSSDAEAIAKANDSSYGL